MTPATAPPGAKGSGRFSRSGLPNLMRGKKSAAFSLRVATPVIALAVTSETSSQPLLMNGGSTSTMARRSFA